MQIVIEIPKAWEKCNIKFIKDCIRNGTPLPKHGRLIDADALEREMIIAEGKAEGGCDYYMSDTIDRAKEYVINAETIIPATKEEIHCYCTTEEIAKSFIEDVSAVKDQLPKQTARIGAYGRVVEDLKNLLEGEGE